MNTNPSSTAPAIAVQPGVTHSASATHAAVHSAHTAHGADLAKLALGAIGVVYGDIGTSPLYAIKECVALPHGVAPVAVNIYGVLSLMALVARPSAPEISGAAADESGALRVSTRTTWTGVRRAKIILIMLGLF